MVNDMENNAIRILSFGEIIWDVFPDRACLGGAPLNFAAHAKKSGAQAYLLSAVGSDELGSRAQEEIARLGVATDYIQVCPDLPTGQCRVTLDEHAVPTYQILSDVAYDRIGAPDSLAPDSFDALAFGTLALRQAYNRDAIASLIARRVCRTVFCDLNLRAPFYTPETVDFCLSHAQVVKLSETELAYVLSDLLHVDAPAYEQGLRALAAAYPNLSLVLLTCGEQGAYAYEVGAGALTYAPAKTVKVVSTVGAGDSFGATFFTHYLQGASIDECLRLATERSAYVVAHLSAIPD